MTDKYFNIIKNIMKHHEETGSPSLSSIKKLERFIDNYEDMVDLFNIFESKNGIVIEFESNKWDFSIEISQSGTIEYWGVEVGENKEVVLERHDDFGPDIEKHFTKHFPNWRAKQSSTPKL